MVFRSSAWVAVPFSARNLLRQNIVVVVNIVNVIVIENPKFQTWLFK